MTGNPAAPQRTFLFHADANAIGGIVNGRNIPSHASSSLPLAGGSIDKEHIVRPGKRKRVVSYTSETTHVSSRTENHPEGGGSWTTLVIARIKGLNILDLVEADEIVAQLEVSHPQDGGEPTITVSGSHFHNLRINGEKVEPVIRFDLFSEHDGSSDPDPKQQYPKKSWLKQDIFLGKIKQQRDQHQKAYAALPDTVKHHFHHFAPSNGQNNGSYFICSLIDKLPELPKHLGVTVCGNGVYIPNYGKFFFGEFIVQEKTFVVSMVRAQLGSANVGPVSAATVRSNGVPSGP